MLLNLIKNQQRNIDNIYLYLKDPFQSKHQFLINGREKVGIKELKNPKAFIDHSQTFDEIYETLGKYNSTKKRKVLIVFDDKIVIKAKKILEANKKLSPIATELFLRERKVNISLVFI